jgi:hypothetical protein
MAHDPQRARAPICRSWAVFFLVTTPHWAALGAAVGYYVPGLSVLTVEQPVDGVPVREFGIEDEVGGALLYLFPVLAAASALISFASHARVRRPRCWWPWNSHGEWVPARSLHPAVLAVSGWGSLAFCVILELSGGGNGGDIFSDVILSPLGGFGSREGRGLIGLASGFAVGFALTATGIWLDRRPTEPGEG